MEINNLFTSRQIVALTAFADLIKVVRKKIVEDAIAAGRSQVDGALHAGGKGATAYADAVVTYLGFSMNRSADRGSSICSWDSSPKMESLRNTFARHAIPMTWDFAEGNPFSNSTGNLLFNVEWTADALSCAPASGVGVIGHINASTNSFPIKPITISTDPPYYDNIGYADLSDFFYIWMRRSLENVWPALLTRTSTDKDNELVATSYRHGGKAEADAFFMRGMSSALEAMRNAADEGTPLAVYYAFKQSETSDNGITSSGWASFLQAIIGAGLAVDGTWPMRTELSNRLIGKDVNALASSVVLVCRKLSALAPTISENGFVRELRKDLPAAVQRLIDDGIAAVDLAQSAIGPGMAIFSKYKCVYEAGDSAMPVRNALVQINAVLREILDDLPAQVDPETAFAMVWFSSFGFEERKAGEAIDLVRAKGVGSLESLNDTGFFSVHEGRARLISRNDLSEKWNPLSSERPHVWGAVQYLVKLLADGGSGHAAGAFRALQPQHDAIRAVAHWIYNTANDKGWNDEAGPANALVTSWSDLESEAAKIAIDTPVDLFA